MIDVSVIVPVYNVSNYLEKCLGSLKCQSHTNLEFICIDDASTDDSRQIIESYASEDNRFHPVYLPVNAGTLQARKKGVETASGQYILFLDGDDWLEHDTCERLLEIMEELPVDILQYGTKLVPASEVSEEMIHWVENYLRPYEKRVEGKEILHACFVERKFDPKITDKMWNAELCRKAFSVLGDQRMVTAEDQYAFFVLCFYAKSYQGIGGANFYNYNLGIGITGGDVLDLKRFENRCAGEAAAREVRRFLTERGVLDALKEEYKAFYNNLLWDCVDCWHNKLKPEDKGNGYDILLKYWKPENVVGALGRVYFESEKEIARMTAASEARKGFMTGIYYRYLGYAPMERYVMSLAAATEESGGSAVLFSDIGAEGFRDGSSRYGEYPVVWLPASADANWGEYAGRAEALTEELRKHRVDRVIYVSPKSHIAWLDMLLIRSMGVAAEYANEGFALEEEHAKAEMARQIGEREELCKNTESALEQERNISEQLECRIRELTEELQRIKDAQLKNRVKKLINKIKNKVYVGR